MTDNLLYVAGMGMISSLGPTLKMTAAAVRAHKSARSYSEYLNGRGEKIVMAQVPDRVFEHIDYEVPEQGDVYNYRHERMLGMMLVSLYECLAGKTSKTPVPTVMTMPEDYVNDASLTPLLPTLAHNLNSWIAPAISRRLCTGRASGIEAVDFVFKYMLNQPQEYVLLISADSFHDDQIICQFSDRLLSPGASDAFAPGEGGCALLLTRHIELAENRNGHVIALHPPGMAEEEGHLYSDKPYRGEGLDKAFKQALQSHPDQSIQAIYSCMNGENYWAKEYGVAYLRNKQKFVDQVRTEHPADCYGELGAVTGMALIALAAEDLRSNKNDYKYLVYSSSDHASRGAVVLEKIAVRTRGHDRDQ